MDLPARSFDLVRRGVAPLLCCRHTKLPVQPRDDIRQDLKEVGMFSDEAEERSADREDYRRCVV